MSDTFVIAQGGGPTAVINRTLVGAVVELKRRSPSARVLGAKHGVRGVVAGDYVDLSTLSEETLMAVGNTAGSALGATRDKPDAAYCDDVLTALRACGAGGFIYIGGNDTASTLELLRDRASQRTGSCHFVHAPKTIDNDLTENDHTPGFISAAEFVGHAFVGMDLDFRALPGIYVGIVMGRHAGFLTASAAAWRESESDGPHLVYVPEVPFSPDRFLDDVRGVYDRFGRCVVAMSEGVQDDRGRPLMETLSLRDGDFERDAHGNVHLSGGELGTMIQHLLRTSFPRKRVRVDTFGYLPRGYPGVVSEVDRQEAFMAGRMAAQTVLDTDGSIAVRWNGAATHFDVIDLSLVAGKTRRMPLSFLDETGTSLSSEGRAYFRRLVSVPPRLPPEFA